MFWHSHAFLLVYSCWLTSSRHHFKQHTNVKAGLTLHVFWIFFVYVWQRDDDFASEQLWFIGHDDHNGPVLAFSCFHLSLCSAAVCWVLLSHTNLNSLQLLLVHSRCLILFLPSKLFINLILFSVSKKIKVFVVVMTVVVIIVTVDFILADLMFLLTKLL